MHFAYVKVPLRRPGRLDLEALHHALQQALNAAGMGSLVSWGTSLPSAGATEGAPGSFHRVDVELHELEPGLRVLRDALLTRAPPGTELHFTEQGAALQQSLSPTGWGEQMASTGTHRPRTAQGGG